MLDELEAALKGEYASDFYLFNSNGSRKEISELAERYNFCLLYLDSLTISNASEFFDAFGTLINYNRSRFGDAGYDRLSDVLGDLEYWGDPRCCPETASGLLLFYDGIWKFADHDPKGFETIIEVIQMSGQGREEHQVGHDANGVAIMEPFPHFILFRGGNIPGVPEMHKSLRRTSKQ